MLLPAERHFYFRHPDGQLAGGAGNVNEFQRSVRATDLAVLGLHVGRRDFWRWVLEIIGDEELGRQLRRLEGVWARGEALDLGTGVALLIVNRYGPEVV